MQQFSVKRKNPLQSFPTLTLSSSTSNISLSAALVKCLLIGMSTPYQPHRRIQLHKGLNLVTTCVTLTADLTGSSLFGSNLFLKEIIPHHISGPSFLLEIQSTSPPPVICHLNTKSHPSRPIDPSCPSLLCKKLINDSYD